MVSRIWMENNRICNNKKVLAVQLGLFCLYMFILKTIIISGIGATDLTKVLHLEMFFMQTVEKRISSELAVRAIFHHPASCFWLGVCQPVLVLACSCLVSLDWVRLTSLDNNISTVWPSFRCANEFHVCQPALTNSAMDGFWLGMYTCLSNTVTI